MSRAGHPDEGKGTTRRHVWVSTTSGGNAGWKAGVPQPGVTEPSRSSHEAGPNGDLELDLNLGDLDGSNLAGSCEDSNNAVANMRRLEASQLALPESEAFGMSC